jgi:hypothetical protein
MIDKYISQEAIMSEVKKFADRALDAADKYVEANQARNEAVAEMAEVAIDGLSMFGKFLWKNIKEGAAEIRDALEDEVEEGSEVQ